MQLLNAAGDTSLGSCRRLPPPPLYLQERLTSIYFHPATNTNVFQKRRFFDFQFAKPGS